MSLSLPRRSAAVLAATALLSTGGLASGLLVGVASAAPLPTAVTPSAVSNAGTAATSLTISGSGFTPAADTVTLHPTRAGDEVADITATVDTVNSTPSALKVTVPLTLAAPVPYDVVVSEPGTTPAPTCSACLTVTNPGRPTVQSVVRDTGDGFLIVSGSNIARGAVLEFLTPDGLVDPKLTFKAGRDTTTATGTTHATGYPSATTLKGQYTAAIGAVTGRHTLRIRNLDDQASLGTAVDFFQPAFTSLAPAALGMGASKVPVTATGAGIRDGSTLSIAQSSGTVTDLTFGTSTVGAGGTTVTVPVSVGTNGAATARSITVRGPDGGYVTKAAAFQVDAGPTVSDSSDPTAPTQTTPSKLGRGGVVDITITGTGFAQGLAVDFGDPAVTTVTKSVAADGTSAVITTTAGPTSTLSGSAVLGGHNVTVTNPDFGSHTTANDGTATGGSYPLTIDAAPVITAVQPASASPGTTQTVTLTGTGFDTTNGMTAAFGPGITVNSVTVPSATTAVVSITVAASPAGGTRNITLVNKGDQGSSTCTACFGINALTPSPTAGANSNNNLDVTFTASAGNDLSGSTGVVLSKTGAPDYQPDIPGTGLVPATSTLKATFDLTSAAPGAYNAVISTPAGPVSCTSCFTITGGNVTVTSVTPGKAGQGAVDYPVSIAGTGFSRGENVTLTTPATSTTAATTAATVTDVVFVSPTSLTAKLTVPAGTSVGKKDVTVTNSDGSGGDGTTNTLAMGFEVVAGPTVSTVARSAGGSTIGQGAANQVFGVVGSGFTAKSVASISGTGVTATTKFVDATHLTITLAATDAADIGPRDVVVTNPDDGGTGTLAKGLTVTLKPSVTGVSPNVAKAGGDAVSVTFVGSGFASGTTFNIIGTTVGAPTVASDGTSATATVTADAGTTLGKRAVFVVNSDGGQSALGDGFAVALAPSAPTAVAVTRNGTTAHVTWAAPATDNGSPVTSYMVSDGTTSDDQTVSASTTSADFSNLTAGASYPFSVVATNAVGSSGPAFVAASPPTTVTVTPQDQQAVVTFGSGNGNGRAITHYRVTATAGSFVRTVVVGAQSYAVVTGLTNGTAYTFTVAASNSDAAPYSYGANSVSRTATPRFTTRVTNVVKAGSTVQGNVRTVSGTLFRTRTGTRLPGARIVLRVVPRAGSASTVTVTTNSSGVWSYSFRPTYSTAVTAVYTGDTADSPTYRGTVPFVATRISITSPKAGSSSSAAYKLVVTGATSPNKSGSTIYLYKYVSGRDVTLGSAKVASNGTYRITASLGRGTYTIRTSVPASYVNTKGYSPGQTLKRT